VRANTWHVRAQPSPATGKHHSLKVLAPSTTESRRSQLSSLETPRHPRRTTYCTIKVRQFGKELSILVLNSKLQFVLGSAQSIPPPTTIRIPRESWTRLTSSRLQMGALKYVEELQKKKQSDVLRFLLRVRCWEVRTIDPTFQVQPLGWTGQTCGT
jgi:hypothetical protein